MAQVTLAQKPLEVAVTGGANFCAAQRGALAAVALRVGLVALLAVFAIHQPAGRNRLRIAGKRIGARVILRRDLLPPGI